MKGRTRGISKGGKDVSFGDFGLQALQPGLITARQIEAARVAITRSVKKIGKLYIRIFPDKPITKKPAETRMGKGKGANEGYVAVIRPGRVIFELEGVDEALAKKAFNAAHHKLPLQTQVISRDMGL
jgi:large subunit ribosomal protein L16